MNGTDDPILPYDGGQIGVARGIVMSTNDSVAYWVERNGANPTATRTDLPDADTGDMSTIVRYTYDAGPGGAVVEHYEMVGAGHTEPSSAERYGRIYKAVVGEQNGDIEMAEEIWKFFAAS
jgi:polyhydroxybutyrate depolymerase